MGRAGSALSSWRFGRGLSPPDCASLLMARLVQGAGPRPGRVVLLAKLALAPPRQVGRPTRPAPARGAVGSCPRLGKQEEVMPPLTWGPEGHWNWRLWDAGPAPPTLSPGEPPRAGR